MKCRLTFKLTLTLIFLALFTGSGIAAPLILQQGARNLGRRGAAVTPGVPPINGLAPIQDVIEGFYVSRFQQELQLEDDQFVQLLPSLRGSLEQRNQLSQRRNRVLNALRQALERGASDDELNRLVEELDESDRQLRSVQENLLREVDPALSPEQRARFRIVQPNVENRIRNLIERSRNADALNRRQPPR